MGRTSSIWVVMSLWWPLLSCMLIHAVAADWKHGLPWCTTEWHGRSFLPVAIRLFNSCHWTIHLVMFICLGTIFIYLWTVQLVCKSVPTLWYLNTYSVHNICLTQFILLQSHLFHLWYLLLSVLTAHFVCIVNNIVYFMTSIPVIFLLLYPIKSKEQIISWG